MVFGAGDDRSVCVCVWDAAARRPPAFNTLFFYLSISFYIMPENASGLTTLSWEFSGFSPFLSVNRHG